MDDIRMGEIIEQGIDGDIVLLGFANDEGVRRNGGRLGASAGPATLRRIMRRVGTVINPETGCDISPSVLKITDAGDVGAHGTLESRHQELTERVGAIIAKGGIPFVVGGGNDQSYPNACGLLDNGLPNVGVINIDAHLDVRPLKEGKAHSGSPFRQLLEDPRFDGQRFTEFAAQGDQCSAVHADYVKEQKGRLFWFSQLRSSNSVVETFRHVLNTSGDTVFVSFDIDSIAGADCPGVSAPAVVGLSAQEALDMCYEAGLHPNVKLFDLSEFNPAIEDYRTGRLVAHMFYHFVMGYSERKKKPAAAASSSQ